jgi:PAS domain S-box-containing protein
MAALVAPAVDLSFLRGGGATAALIAQFDWATTGVGPVAAWPQCLKDATSLLLQSPIPIVLFWGGDGTMIYNDAYARLIGHRHPQALGARASQVWPAHVDLTRQILDAGFGGRALSLHNRELEVNRAGRKERAWFDFDCSPVRDEHGEPAGVLVISVETTQRILAERKAAHQLERQRTMFEQAPGAICLLSGPELTVEFTNAAHRRLFGVHDAEGRPYMDAFAEIAALGTPETIFEVYRTGRRHLARSEPITIPRPGREPEVRLLDLVLEPVLDEDGRVRGVFLEGFDVTDRVQALRTAEESNRRLGAALAVARLGTFEWESETDTMTLDARAREIFGFRPDERVTRADVDDRIDRADYVRVKAETVAADAAGRTRRAFEFRVHRPDGSVRSVAAISEGSRTSGSRLFTGVFDDVTERRAAERRQRMLINELNHRVKNTLATVQSIAAQTLHAASSVASAREEFESRLVALAAAHDLLTAQGWRGALLADVAATAMSPFEPVHRPRITRLGRRAWVTAQQAMALNLALHELATNAAKYGALSVAEGRVDLSWSVSGDEVTLRWVEQGGPPVTARAHAGFGSRLLQHSLARELGGEVEWTFAAEGVRCQIRCKVEQAPLQADYGEPIIRDM